ncbi:MAG: hypothetical protein OSB57_04120 [Planctomycetota bacterium]|nr:hypothetical protein [Planctomycetota bacterium]
MTDGASETRDPGGRWVKGTASPNPGGMPRGFVKPSVLLKKYGDMTLEELQALENLTMAELRARATLVDGILQDDPGVRLKYILAADDRVEGKPHQSNEVKLQTLVDPMTVDATRTERAMAAAELLRAQGLKVPGALQTLIEQGEDDD